MECLLQYLDDLDKHPLTTSKTHLFEKGVAATRQLAKRQLTWLRSWKSIEIITTDFSDFEKNLVKTLNFLKSKSI